MPGIDFKDFSPEAMFVDQTGPSSGSALSLSAVSDDGDVKLEEDGVQGRPEDEVAHPPGEDQARMIGAAATVTCGSGRSGWRTPHLPRCR